MCGGLGILAKMSAGRSSLVIPSYTGAVKTAISVPDETFQRVSRRARQLHLSRSQFFARAAERYLDELDAQALSGQIDAALERVGGGLDQSTADAVAIGRRTLAGGDEAW